MSLSSCFVEVCTPLLLSSELGEPAFDLINPEFLMKRTSVPGD